MFLERGGIPVQSTTHAKIDSKLAGKIVQPGDNPTPWGRLYI
jgi:hypothetical protein